MNRQPAIAALVLAAVVTFAPFAVKAQTSQTLADIRQELTVLHVEIQRLKRELSTTGAPSTNLSGTGVLDRVNAIEAELQRLTSQTEQMDFRIQQIVADGTNRIGDLEFRLVELEGGDVSQLGETTTLGGEAGNAPALGNNGAAPAATDELAVGEQADFEAARAALDQGDYQTAIAGLAAFDQDYPGSPLGASAHLLRGQALDGSGDTREAARAYLASFTRDSSGPTASRALLELGAALGRLGQTEQACVTLGEVAVRFPVSDEVAMADREMSELGCS